MSTPLTADKQEHGSRNPGENPIAGADGLADRSGIRIYPDVCGTFDGRIRECPGRGAVAGGLRRLVPGGVAARTRRSSGSCGGG